MKSMKPKKKPLRTRFGLLISEKELAKKLRIYQIFTKTQAEQDAEERFPPDRFPDPISLDRLNGAHHALPACGCGVTGRGTERFPIRIVFCDLHGKMRP